MVGPTPERAPQGVHTYIHTFFFFPEAHKRSGKSVGRARGGPRARHQTRRGRAQRQPLGAHAGVQRRGCPGAAPRRAAGTSKHKQAKNGGREPDAAARGAGAGLPAAGGWAATATSTRPGGPAAASAAGAGTVAPARSHGRTPATRLMPTGEPRAGAAGAAEEDPDLRPVPAGGLGDPCNRARTLGPAGPPGPAPPPRRDRSASRSGPGGGCRRGAAGLRGPSQCGGPPPRRLRRGRESGIQGPADQRITQRWRGRAGPCAGGQTRRAPRHACAGYHKLGTTTTWAPPP